MGTTAERRGVPFRTLAWAGIGFTCLVALGAWFAYLRLLHYRRCAVEHLLPEAQLVARLDVEQVVLFEPVRRHLLPLLNALPLTLAAGQGRLADADRLGRLRRDAGLNLGLDLREIVVATADRGQRWVVVFGGLFPHAGLVPAIEQALQGSGAAGWAHFDAALEFTPSGVSLGQAEDGVLILASDPDTLRASLLPSEQFHALGLSREGAGAARLSREALTQWLSAPGDASAAVESLGLALRLGNEVEVDVQLELRDAREATAFAARWSRPSIAGPASGPATEGWGPWALLARVEQVEHAENTVQMVTRLRPAELDRAARDLAAWIQRSW
jgi:hypothetical protein